ncbi:hypothetical protein DMENIID0001_167250 [Sergentomyia squamirostris]
MKKGFLSTPLQTMCLIVEYRASFQLTVRSSVATWTPTRDVTPKAEPRHNVRPFQPPQLAEYPAQNTSLLTPMFSWCTKG